MFLYCNPLLDNVFNKVVIIYSVVRLRNDNDNDHDSDKRVSMGWWLLRLSAKMLALLRLSVNFFQLRLTKKLKINFFCLKKLNINQPVFF